MSGNIGAYVVDWEELLKHERERRGQEWWLREAAENEDKEKGIRLIKKKGSDKEKGVRLGFSLIKKKGSG